MKWFKEFMSEKYRLVELEFNLYAVHCKPKLSFEWYLISTHASFYEARDVLQNRVKEKRDWRQWGKVVGEFELVEEREV